MSEHGRRGPLIQIRVKGHLDSTWSEWFDGLSITNLAHGEALLCGRVADQAALHGVLTKVRDLGLPLLSVNRVDDAEREEDQAFARQRQPP